MIFIKWHKNLYFNFMNLYITIPPCCLWVGVAGDDYLGPSVIPGPGTVLVLPTIHTGTLAPPSPGTGGAAGPTGTD